MDKLIIDPPKSAGSYALCLRMDQTQKVRVGRLGEFVFPAGEYLYLGSAHGPGGLRARLGRHLRGDGVTRWHVDALRRVSHVRSYLYTPDDPSTAPSDTGIPIECAWSQALAGLPGAAIPAPGFGASDCKAGCPAHLVALPPPGDRALELTALAEILARAAGVPRRKVTQCACKISGSLDKYLQ